jgi:hypothetical protein
MALMSFIASELRSPNGSLEKRGLRRLPSRLIGLMLIGSIDMCGAQTSMPMRLKRSEVSRDSRLDVHNGADAPARSAESWTALPSLLSPADVPAASDRSRRDLHPLDACTSKLV